MESSLTRRSFVRWSAATAAGASLVGLVACADNEPENSDSKNGEQGGTSGVGVWKTGACNHNCSCGSSRCLLKVYVEDGVPLQIQTDEEDSDTIDMLQKRACLRGRAQISHVLSPARIKYPMKRKNWSPENPNGELRGKDEWERISWDEALDLVADEVGKIVESSGSKAIHCCGSSDIGYDYFDQTVCLLNALGGARHNEAGTVSFGAWSVADTHMVGGWQAGQGVHPLRLAESELIVMFGCNWAANKAGNTPYQLNHAREQGTRIIMIDPWLNQTAQAIADEWIPILPGTDTAFMMAMNYHWIENDQYDQEYLDKYTIGFDAEHMPEGANPDDNYKDYILGTHDGEPKTAEWAEKKCGVPAATIRDLAERIGTTEKVYFTAAMSTSKIPAGEQVAQTFYTMALMHGKIGAPGCNMSWAGLGEGFGGGVSFGNATNAEANPVNPLQPAGAPIYMAYPIPTWSTLEDPQGWSNLNPSETWQSILEGEYGREVWPGGKHQIETRAIYFGGYASSLNQLPNANAGIKAVRSVDFVWGMGPFFDPSRQYCDIVLPSTSWWEKGNFARGGTSEFGLWFDTIMEPLFEAKSDGEIAEELASRLGVDPKTVNTLEYPDRGFATVRDATINGEPLFTITEEDIAELGATGEPQSGAASFAEFKEKGIYKYDVPPAEYIAVPYQAYYEDPEANPLNTASGKFEIYCEVLAAQINATGYSQIEPIGKWQIGDPEHGHGTQTEEYPLLLWTPHSLRRAHSVNDNAISLREAFPQECFISVVDAEARGIKNGDPVLMTSPHGKVLRPAKVMSTIVPGAVALQDGAWLRIDEETGIDLGGDPNILQAPKASGGGTQCWTGTLVQVEKYTGDLELVPDKDCPIVMPVGVE